MVAVWSKRRVQLSLQTPLAPRVRVIRKMVEGMPIRACAVMVRCAARGILVHGREYVDGIGLTTLGERHGATAEKSRHGALDMKETSGRLEGWSQRRQTGGYDASRHLDGGPGDSRGEGV